MIGETEKETVLITIITKFMIKRRREAHQSQDQDQRVVKVVVEAVEARAVEAGVEVVRVKAVVEAQVGARAVVVMKRRRGRARIMEKRRWFWNTRKMLRRIRKKRRMRNND